ncbi:MAG: T9SS type A sorting domain-containing protein [Bacteroidales bacterium]
MAEGTKELMPSSSNFGNLLYRIVCSLLLSFFTVSPVFLKCQPVNDDICNAISLAVNSNYCYDGTNVGATTVSSDKIGSCWIGGTKSHTVWYTFTAPASGNVMVTTDNSGGTLTNSQLAIFSSSDNTCNGTLTEEECDENGGSGCDLCAAAVLTGLTPGKIYFVELDGYSTENGTFCIDVHDGGDILTNDDCANAMNMWVGSSCNLQNQCTYTTYPNSINTGATGEISWETAPACWTQGTALNTVWYKFTAVNTTTNIQIEYTGGGAPDPHVAVYSGACGSLALVACQEDNSGKEVNLSFSTTVAQTYYIQYDSDKELGCNKICLNSSGGSAVPSNNACASAQTLVLNTPVNSDNWLATDDGSFSCGTTENSVWYKFTPLISGIHYFTLLSQEGCYNFNNSASTHTSFYGASLQMVVYNTSTCTPSSSSEFDCVSSENSNNIDISASLTGGLTYLIMVDGLYGASCEFFIEASDYNVLPVSLISFNGYNKEDVNIIEWITASETNNDYFTIERSANAKDFGEIGHIKGAGNSNTSVNYSFTDYELENIVNYYRLKQTDLDGKINYPSTIIAIDNSEQNQNPLTVFPNPNDGIEIKINVNGFNSNEVVITIQDILGRILYAKKTDTEMDKSNTIPVMFDDKLNSGIYFVSVSNDEISLNKKIVVK